MPNTRMLRTLIKSLRDLWNDPFHIQRDWDAFGKMNDEQLRAEYKRLYAEDPAGPRFRRLNFKIASTWVYLVPVMEEVRRLQCPIGQACTHPKSARGRPEDHKFFEQHPDKK